MNIRSWKYEAEVSSIPNIYPWDPGGASLFSLTNSPCWEIILMYDVPA